VNELRIPELQNVDTWTSLDSFRHQIYYLKQKFEFISLKAGIKLLEQGKIDGNYASLTFDDGDISIKEVIPFLIEEKIPATFFINSAYLGDARKSWADVFAYIQSVSNLSSIPKDVYYAFKILRNTLDIEEYNKYRIIAEDYVNNIKFNKPKYLTVEDLNAILNPLFNIGLHGHEHQRYSMMSKDWCAKDVDTCINKLSSHPLYVPIIALPFGKSHDWDEKIISVCIDRGLKIMLHDGGINYKKKILYDRIPCDGRDINTNFIASNFIS
jgi:peptidoglycan/xylan/chitin deacetylase (PgdA/CDA1 family)